VKDGLSRFKFSPPETIPSPVFFLSLWSSCRRRGFPFGLKRSTVSLDVHQSTRHQSCGSLCVQIALCPLFFPLSLPSSRENFAVLLTSLGATSSSPVVGTRWRIWLLPFLYMWMAVIPGRGLLLLFFFVNKLRNTFLISSSWQLPWDKFNLTPILFWLPNFLFPFLSPSYGQLFFHGFAKNLFLFFCELPRFQPRIPLFRTSRSSPPTNVRANRTFRNLSARDEAFPFPQLINLCCFWGDGLEFFSPPSVPDLRVSIGWEA